MEHTLELNNFTINPAVFDYLLKHNVFDKVLHDDITPDNIYEEFSHSTMVQVGVDGSFVGVFTLEDLGTHLGKRVVEIHAYFVPHERRHSLAMLREFRNFIFATTSFECIVTNVPDCYPLHQRAVKMVGFKPFANKENVMRFKGEPTDMTYFYLNKD